MESDIKLPVMYASYITVMYVSYIKSSYFFMTRYHMHSTLQRCMNLTATISYICIIRTHLLISLDVFFKANNTL